MACYNIYRTTKRNANSKGKKKFVYTFPSIMQAKVALFSTLGIKHAMSYLGMAMGHKFNIPNRSIEITKNEDNNMLTLVYDDGRKYAEHIYTIEQIPD